MRTIRKTLCYSHGMKPLRIPVGFSTPGPVASNALAGRVRPSGTFSRRLRSAWLRVATGVWAFVGLAANEAGGQDTPPEPAAIYRAPTAPRELLKVDEPMRRFFAERLKPHHDRADQLRALLDAIHRPDGLNFIYDRELTSDARETFRQRRGNCVSYSFLVVAIAREFGFDASFQNVARPIKWDRIDKLVISVRHMNVRVDLGPEYYLIDLRPDMVSRAVPSDMQVITDERAFAEFYDTAGFFELLHGNPDEAMQLMILATTVDPHCAQAWSNRASMHTHLGNLEEARACFERAIKTDRGDLFALEGYVGILHRLGSKDDLRIAAKYERRAQSVRDRNPYYQQRLAERAQELGDWVAAEKLLRRAISLKRDEPQFHEQRVQALLQLGRADDARRATAKLEKLRLRLAAAQIQHTP